MSRFLEAFRAEIEKQQANVFSVAEFCDGKLETMQLVRTNPCQNCYSVAKVYIVTAIGMLVDRGLLSTEETVAQLLDARQTVWEDVTVDMLLLHKVPLPEGCLDIDVHNAVLFGEDYLSYVLHEAVQPDLDTSVDRYTDAAFYLLARIVEKRAGMKADDFLWKNLFYPTGCREAAWSHCPMGHPMGGSGLYIRTEELAKLGAIYLQGGCWQGKRILSGQWVDTVLRREYELKPQRAEGVVAKAGMRGQMLALVPSANRVVAFQGCGNYALLDFIANYA